MSFQLSASAWAARINSLEDGRVVVIMKAIWWRAMRSGIARDITFAMTIKLVLLAALFALFARQAHQPASDAAATATAVVGSAKDEKANP